MTISYHNSLPYVIALPKNSHTWKMEEWCIEKFGERWNAIDYRQGKWCVFWRGYRVTECPGGYDWLFKNEQDAMLFTLRWL